MNVFTNDGYFKAQLERARQLRFWGILALAVAFAASMLVQFVPGIPPLLVLASYPFLFAGFPMWTIGNNRLKVLKAAVSVDQKITAELKGFSDKYTLHHYATVDGKTVKHLLVAPVGLIVMESRDTTGPITCTDDKWKGRTSWLERMAGVSVPLGDPTADTIATSRLMCEKLNSIGKPEVPVAGLIVFSRATDIQLDGSTYGAVPVAEVKVAVRQMLSDMAPEREERSNVGVMLTSDDRRKLNALLAPAQPEVAAKPSPARVRS